ncbi:MAG: ABC transporter ATP-binding protein [Acidovorax sp.]|nr:ABC transporter ATP-binding protein [Acidovorax sp.]
MTNKNVMLDVHNISVEFGGLKAVSDFSMQVRQGSIHALIGPNGAGKSTVFNCISRFYTPNQGSVKFLGEELLALDASEMASRGIARSFQNLELFAELSALDNVLLGTHAQRQGTAIGPLARLKRLLSSPDKAATAFAESLLERVGLADQRHVLAKDMNFGHQKLLELARAMAIRPRLLLLDEPAAGLRNREIESLDRILKEMVSRDGMTVLLVEHVMQLVMSISDDITVLAFGKKIAEGAPKDIATNPLVIEAYLGTDAVAQAKGAQ